MLETMIIHGGIPGIVCAGFFCWLLGAVLFRVGS